MAATLGASAVKKKKEQARARWWKEWGLVVWVVAAVVVASLYIMIYGPYTFEGLVKVWYKSGGYIQTCTDVMTAAMVTSGLSCSYQQNLANGTRRLGLFGLDPTLHDIAPACALNCACTVKHVVKMTRFGKNARILPNFKVEEGKQYEVAAGNACREIGEDMMKSGTVILG